MVFIQLTKEQAKEKVRELVYPLSLNFPVIFCNSFTFEVNGASAGKHLNILKYLNFNG